MANFTYKKGNILQETADAITNPVNTVGVMGKGLALQFKKQFSKNYTLYRQAAQQNQLQTGKLFCTKTDQLLPPQYIINFPTKKHWKDKSQLSYVEEGLDDLVKFIEKTGLKSIAIPPLGCGLGGLEWKTVKPLIEEKLAPIIDLQVIIFEPL